MVFLIAAADCANDNALFAAYQVRFVAVAFNLPANLLYLFFCSFGFHCNNHLFIPHMKFLAFLCAFATRPCERRRKDPYRPRWEAALAEMAKERLAELVSFKKGKS